MFDNIILFTYLVEIGNYSKTAEMVRLSQSTLSKRIIELENALDTRLFIRDTRNLELTKEGLLIYQRYKYLRQSIKKTIAAIAGEAPERSGELRLSLSTVISGALITPFIGLYSQRNPKVILNICYQTTPPDPESWPFDISLSFVETVPQEGFHNYEVRQEFAQLYCTPAYAIKNGLPLSVEDLDGHQVVGIIDSNANEIPDLVRFVNKYTNQEFLHNNVRCRTKMNSATHMRLMGLTDDYIFGSWRYLCEKDVLEGRLIPVLSEYYTVSVKFYLCCRYKLTELEESCINFIQQCLQRSLNFDLATQL